MARLEGAGQPLFASARGDLPNDADPEYDTDDAMGVEELEHHVKDGCWPAEEKNWQTSEDPNIVRRRRKWFGGLLLEPDTDFCLRKGRVPLAASAYSSMQIHLSELENAGVGSSGYAFAFHWNSNCHVLHLGCT